MDLQANRLKDYTKDLSKFSYWDPRISVFDPDPTARLEGDFFPIKYLLEKKILKIFCLFVCLSSLFPLHTAFRAQMELSHKEFPLKFPIWEEFIGFLIINRTLIKQRNKFPSLSGVFWHLVIWVHK